MSGGGGRVRNEWVGGLALLPRKHNPPRAFSCIAVPRDRARVARGKRRGVCLRSLAFPPHTHENSHNGPPVALQINLLWVWHYVLLFLFECCTRLSRSPRQWGQGNHFLYTWLLVALCAVFVSPSMYVGLYLILVVFFSLSPPFFPPSLSLACQIWLGGLLSVLGFCIGFVAGTKGQAGG